MLNKNLILQYFDSENTFNQVVEELKVYIGTSGIEYFKDLKEKYDEYLPVINNKNFPYPTHFHEGMNIRNFIRGTFSYKQGKIKENLDDVYEQCIISAVENLELK